MSENKIKILDITSYMLCPPKSGGALRMIAPLYDIPKESRISIDFLFAKWDSNDSCKCVRYLERIPCVRKAEYTIYEPGTEDVRGMPEEFPLQVWLTISDSLRKKTIKMITEEKYDIIQIEHSFIAWIVPTIRKYSPESKIVLDAHNVEYRILELTDKYIPDKKTRQDCESLKNWERKIWNWFDAVFTVSPVEEKIIREASTVKKSYLVPTGGGIDVSKYTPQTKSEKQYDILYIGTMNWQPNAHGLIWFIENVWPKIIHKRPETRFHIIGSGEPVPRLVKLAESTKNVEFLGFQADDVAFFHSSKVFVVPLWIGGGARVKIPTAWASKIPVVSTTFGAEGNGAINGENIILADTPEDFANGVLKILESEEYGDMLVENAIKWVEEKFTTKYCAKKLIEAYKDILE